MVKRIPCRVISTAAFSKTSAGSSSVNRMNNHQHERDGVAVVDIKPKHISILADNPKSFDIGLGILNDFPIGQILDCYA